MIAQPRRLVRGLGHALVRWAEGPPASGPTVAPAPQRAVVDVFNSLEAKPDPAAMREAATNPAEAAFYAQRDRETRKWHHYHAIYDRHLARYRGTGVRLLEIGVHNGGSLQVMRRYLGPEAVIHGLDLDPRCATIDDPDLTIHIGSQDDAALLKRIVAEMGGLDVVIDDGSHIWPHQIATFETLFPLVAGDGVYLCEDTHTSYWPEFGGGRPASDSFVSYARRLVDRLYAPYSLDPTPPADDFARRTAGVAFYDSVVVVEKAESPPPFHVSVGGRAVIV